MASPAPCLLISQSFGQQGDGLLKFNSALGQAFLVDGIALHQMLFEYTGCPLAKLHTTLGFNAITHGDNHIQVVVIHLVGFTIGGSCCFFCNN